MRKLKLFAIIGFTGFVSAWGAGEAAVAPADDTGPRMTSTGASTGSSSAVSPATAVVGGDRESSDDVGSVTILSSGNGGCTFEVRVPELGVTATEAGGRMFERYAVAGYGRSGDAGAPELLVKTVNVAVPPGAEVAVRVDRVSFDLRAGAQPYPRPKIEVVRRRGETSLKETFAFDAAAYRAGVYPAKWAEISDQGYMRGYRVVAVAVHPYQYDGDKGAVRVATNMVVTVSFVGGVTRPNATYPARPAEEGAFSRLIPASLLNWKVAAQWPFAETFAASDAEIWPTSFADKPALKIILEEEGLYHLDYAELKNVGFPVDTARPANLRLYAASGREISRDIDIAPEGLEEVACYVAGQGDGVFDRADYVEFYGRGCDFLEPITPGENGAQTFVKNRFTKYNVYWLVADATAGKRAAPASSAPAGGTSPSYFWDRIHVESDKVDIGEGAAKVAVDDDYFMWMQFNAGESAPSYNAVGTFNIWDPVVGGPPAYFKIQVQPAAASSNGQILHSKAYVNYRRGANEVFDETYDGGEPVVFYRDNIPVSLFTAGTNRFWFEEVGDRVHGKDIDSVFLNYFEFEYPRRYRAHQGYLRFSNPPGTTGEVLFEIKGFDSDDVVVYDITRGRRLADFETKTEDGAYTIRFTDNIPAGQCWYVAATAAGADKDPVDMYLDVGSRLRDDDENRDEIVVTYDGYLDNIQPLVNWRRAQGLAVAVAPITDVYDEYNGGVFDPGAIRLYARDLYVKSLRREGGRLPDHLLLVGDAWRDWRDAEGKYRDHKLYRDFGMNQCPTYYLICGPTDRAASDNFFVAFDESGWPDMTVGRFSCPFDENVDAIVDKILAYERDPVNGPWTARCVLVADNCDIHTSTEGGGGTGNFTENTETLAELYFPYGFEADKQYITWLNRRFPYVSEQEGEDGFDGMNRDDRKKYVREFMKPNFYECWDALIVGYSGHGGPQAWAHEALFEQHKDVPIIDDIYKLKNGPRYPIVFQCSCSTCYFDDERTPGPNDPPDYGQSISEYGLDEPRNAAVAMMGSTRVGYEDPQDKFMRCFYSYIFPNRRPRTAAVTVGEAHFSGKVNSGEESVRAIYTLLGDPAMPIAVPKPGIDLVPAKMSVRLGETLAVAGTVPDNLNGKATVSLFDKVFYCTDRISAENTYRDRLIATAEVEIRNGRFNVTFTVPVTPDSPLVPSGVSTAPAVSSAAGALAAGAAASAVDAAGPNALASALASAATPDAAPAAPVDSGVLPVGEGGELYVRAIAYGTGFRQSFFCDEEITVAVTGAITSNDRNGPEVDIYLGDRTFRDGDPVGPNPALLVDVRDSSGVLIARNTETIGTAEKIFLPLTAKVDNGTATDLTHYYAPTYNDTRSGSAEAHLALATGSHRVTVTAYDNFGNKTTKTVKCLVSGSLAIVNAMNCPNPFDEETYFTFQATTDVDSLSIKVYTATGRLIQRIDAGGLAAGYHQIRWEGRDRAGDPIANGVYFYTITARAGDQKIVIRDKLVKLK